MKRGIFCILICTLMIGTIFPISGTFMTKASSFSNPTLTTKEENVQPLYTGSTHYFDMNEIDSVGQAAWGITAADFNNDGQMDFAVSSSNHITLYNNDGNATFTRMKIYSFRYNIDSMVAKDFNNDGYTDLLFSYSEDVNFTYKYGVISLLLNDGYNNFDNATFIARRDRIHPRISAGDYDQDGSLDFIIGDNSGKIELFYNDGSGTFTSAGIIHDWGKVSWGVASADFDGDGNIDFLVSTEGNGLPYSAYIYLKLNQKKPNDLPPVFNKGPGKIIAYPDVSCGSLTALDYDNDGDLDFIATEMNRLFLYIYDQGVYFPCLIGSLSDPYNFRGTASADFNNDGYIDFITVGWEGTIHLFINNNNQPFGAIIKKPQERHLNIFDRSIPFPVLKRTVVFGKITIEAQPLGNVTKVEFRVNGALKHSDTEPPFTWTWDTPARGKYTIQIIAWDGSGNSNSDTIDVWRVQH
jgi:hypothetical protein